MLFGFAVPQIILTVLSTIGSVLNTLWKIIIPIPLLLVLAICAWWYFDRISYGKAEVLAAVKQYVAGAEIAGLQADIKFKDIVIDRQKELVVAAQKQAEDLKKINDYFEQGQASDDAEIEKLRQDAANEYANHPSKDDPSAPSDYCTKPIGADFYNRLLNNK